MFDGEKNFVFDVGDVGDDGGDDGGFVRIDSYVQKGSNERVHSRFYVKKQTEEGKNRVVIV